MSGFKFNINAFEIIALDEYNFSLFETRDKKAVRGKQSEGKTKVHLGYFANLASALNKIAKSALITKDELYTVQELERAINALESSLNDRFKDIKPKHFNKGAKL